MESKCKHIFLFQEEEILKCNEIIDTLEASMKAQKKVADAAREVMEIADHELKEINHKMLEMSENVDPLKVSRQLITMS